MASLFQRPPSAGPLLLFFFLLSLAACEPQPAPRTSIGRNVGIETRFPVTLDGKNIQVQIALTDLETQRGLMGRNTLAANEGMLFVFAESQQRFFWMRGVPINLALGYFTADGCLDEIKTLVAENPQEVPSRSNAIRFVLEMPEGWFEANNVRQGSMLDLGTVRAAMEARGFKPEQFLEQQNL